MAELVGYGLAWRWPSDEVRAAGAACPTKAFVANGFCTRYYIPIGATLNVRLIDDSS